MGPYAAPKAGVHRLTEVLAAELAGGNVTVNAVLPSMIGTPTNRADMPDADTSAWVEPQALADIILSLPSPAACGISGALIPVERGTEERVRQVFRHQIRSAEPDAMITCAQRFESWALIGLPGSNNRTMPTL